MKKLLIAAGVVIGVLIAAALVVPPFIPTDTYKAQITEQVFAATGRKLTIEGDLDLAILPSLSLTARGVKFANAPGAQRPDMATLKRVEIEVKALPLLAGRVEIDKLVLVEPVINLEVDKAGRPNWDFRPAGAAKPDAAAKPAAKAKTPAAPGGEKAGPGLPAIRLADVRVVDGTIRYRGADGSTREVRGANVTLSLPGPEGPFTLTGRLTLNGQELAIDGRLARPDAMLTKDGTPANLSVRSKLVTLSFKGSLAGGEPTGAKGALTVSVPSVRRLAAFAGSPLAIKGTGMGAFKLSAGLVVSESAISVTKAVMQLDGNTVRGSWTISTAGKVPSIRGTLTVAPLDLNPYLGPPAGAPAKAPSKKGARKPRRAASGWSTASIDATALRSVNADLRVTASNIRYRKIRVDQGAIRVKLAAGRLTATLSQLALYKGNGSGSLTVESARGGIRLRQAFKLSGLQARPFLRDAAGTERLSGRANITYAVAGAGRSQRQIVAGLSGKGAVRFTNGAIRGFNLAQMMRTLSPSALKAGFDSSKKTDFAMLGGTFVIRKGVLRNDDLVMQSPLLRVRGKGTVNLLPRTLNYRIEPKVVGSLRGQGDKFGRKGVVVPVIVTGPWDNPSWRPDLAAALQINADGSLGRIKDLKKGLTKEGVKGLLKGVTGGKKDGESKGDGLQKRLKGLIK